MASSKVKEEYENLCVDDENDQVEIVNNSTMDSSIDEPGKSHKLNFSTADGTEFQISVPIEMDVHQASEACQAVAQSLGKGDQSITLLLDSDSPFQQQLDMNDETSNGVAQESEVITEEKVNLLVEYGNREVVVECPIRYQQNVISLLEEGNFSDLYKFDAVVREKDESAIVKSDDNYVVDDNSEFIEVDDQQAAIDSISSSSILENSEFDGRHTVMHLKGSDKTLQVEGSLPSLISSGATGGKEITLYSCPICPSILFTNLSQLWDHLQTNHKNEQKYRNMTRAEFIMRAQRGAQTAVSAGRGPGRPKISPMTAQNAFQRSQARSSTHTSNRSSFPSFPGLLNQKIAVDIDECRKVYCSPWMFYLSHYAYEFGSRLEGERRDFKSLNLPNYDEIEHEIMQYDEQSDAPPEHGLETELERINKLVAKQKITVADIEKAEEEAAIEELRNEPITYEIEPTFLSTSHLPSRRGRPPKRKYEQEEKQSTNIVHSEGVYVKELLDLGGVSIEIEQVDTPNQIKSRASRKEKLEERKELPDFVIEVSPKKKKLVV